MIITKIKHREKVSEKNKIIKDKIKTIQKEIEIQYKKTKSYEKEIKQLHKTLVI